MLSVSRYQSVPGRSQVTSTSPGAPESQVSAVSVSADPDNAESQTERDVLGGVKQVAGGGQQVGAPVTRFPIQVN